MQTTHNILYLSSTRQKHYSTDKKTIALAPTRSHQRHNHLPRKTGFDTRGGGALGQLLYVRNRRGNVYSKDKYLERGLLEQPHKAGAGRQAAVVRWSAGRVFFRLPGFLAQKHGVQCSHSIDSPGESGPGVYSPGEGREREREREREGGCRDAVMGDETPPTHVRQPLQSV